MAIKAAKGQLPEYAALIVHGAPALEHALAESGFALLAISLEHIAAAYRLPHHHGDPFDRLMIAQALQDDLTLITRDSLFRHYAGLKLLAA